MTLGPRRLGTALLCFQSLSLAAAEPPSSAASPVPRAVAAPTPANPLAQRLCDALHAIPASRRQECCGAGAAVQTLASACASQLSALLRRGSIGLHASGIDRCAAATQSALDGCSWVRPLLPELPAACAGLVDGRLKPGAACRSSLECVDGLYCRGASEDRPGACRPPAPAGAACELPADALAAFTRAADDPRHPSCDGRCERGRCLPVALSGGACASSALCANGLRCIGGKCEARPLPRIGEDCSVGNPCEALAFCDAGKCSPLKGAGAPCRLPFECRALACEKTPGKSTGTCADACAAPGPSVLTPR
jgi:hypothetical protein